ncbi:BQ5605_C019g08892 [Microbotryum silenes-dioicae]|uniref:BQ5605_C019g08892 protein n=1 Tax=Microbotryum silenes-dioicae TaxID=796604 RepID=A0A2X0NZG1_9BASI|nr:BQ5605_C019g08892 [Microbotryum silenes-dioicae]
MIKVSFLKSIHPYAKRHLDETMFGWLNAVWVIASGELLCGTVLEIPTSEKAPRPSANEGSTRDVNRATPASAPKISASPYSRPVGVTSIIATVSRESLCVNTANATSFVCSSVPSRLWQCTQANITFFNSGNVRPLTVAIVPQAKLLPALRKVGAKTTLKSIEVLAPGVEFLTKIRNKDGSPYTFTPHHQRGDTVEVRSGECRTSSAELAKLTFFWVSSLVCQLFAFFPNGTGFNMNLARTIQTGSKTCLTPVCNNTQYLDVESSQCRACISVFPNSTACTATTAKSWQVLRSLGEIDSVLTLALGYRSSYGIVTAGRCVAKVCSGKQTLNTTTGRDCVLVCASGFVLNGKCQPCAEGMYPSPDSAYTLQTLSLLGTIGLTGRIPSSSSSLPLFRRLSGDQCAHCLDGFASTCDPSGSLTCKNGQPVQDGGWCRDFGDCSGFPPRYLAPGSNPKDTNCLACPTNSTSCNSQGQATGCSYGMLDNGSCIVKVNCPNSAVNNDGTACCQDALARSCDSSGSLTCRYGTPVSGLCPTPVECGASTPSGYSLPNNGTCYPCPVNATACDNNVRATACQHGLVDANGFCTPPSCNGTALNTQGTDCCVDPFATACYGTKLSISCVQGYESGGIVNGTVPCQGPFSSYYGSGQGRYTLGGSDPSFPLYNPQTLRDCAIAAYHQKPGDSIFLWQPTHKYCFWTYKAGIHLVPIQNTDTIHVDGFDFGTFGTCADTTRSWSVGSQHAGLDGCEDVLMHW